ncbi:hypothetical protein [Xenorhabdus lircayensis]|uniref:Uncharacterized protein n=1 Tax=Xenorhabdus lircayensis TaxID=2763499 RepID=A0ABS0U4P5_9GAMM|nr:hypothetical protein [Xenorhabdus lircayensis]MBI6547740.1 hypothetical protein [Xenorhabdus lircayensis]
MNQTTAIQCLNKLDQQSRYVFTSKDLAKLFSEDNKRAFEVRLRIQHVFAGNVLE